MSVNDQYSDHNYILAFATEGKGKGIHCKRHAKCFIHIGLFLDHHLNQACFQVVLFIFDNISPLFLCISMGRNMMDTVATISTANTAHRLPNECDDTN